MLPVGCRNPLIPAVLRRFRKSTRIKNAVRTCATVQEFLQNLGQDSIGFAEMRASCKFAPIQCVSTWHSIWFRMATLLKESFLSQHRRCQLTPYICFQPYRQYEKLHLKAKASSNTF
jgi:hypothetical protein